ncbi:DUF6544 family protein [Noviherbaspirillum sp. CPCC 100848]|uniref:DUF6544 family protein n=1 Tax=Noviherbaspirillum album TaxID=3080276 RepID=A0ABU6JJW9_9BURK|nr:DUF6544 family protein [Noviherbaspirillum sp. CPCC 100848]MEC4723595.1 DUF6544 family protein [Noviherbaspirillum sp. CPCC 100848]
MKIPSSTASLVTASLIFAGIAVTVVGIGKTKWHAKTNELRARLDAARRPMTSETVDFNTLTTLPPPVQRFFRTVLKDGQPIVAGAYVKHKGTFNMSESGEKWYPFTSDQRVVTQRPGFDWDGRIKIMPGLSVHVHDAYVAGDGILHASLLGLFTVADMLDKSDVAAGELMRFFAEAAWYPTALLPSQGVRWDAVDEKSAKATLEDGDAKLTMLWTFTEAGSIDTVRAEARGRAVGGKVIPTPWQGRFWNYTQRLGMSIPLDGEVMWLLPDGPKSYWRGHIDEIVYELAQ